MACSAGHVDYSPQGNTSLSRPPVRALCKKKSSSPVRAALFLGLDWRGVSMLHRAAIPLCNTTRFELPGVRRRCCVTSKFDIFCHLSIFFLTSTHFFRISAYFAPGRGERWVFTGNPVPRRPARRGGAPAGSPASGRADTAPLPFPAAADSSRDSAPAPSPCR